MKKKKFIVSIILVRDNTNGSINIVNNLTIMDAKNKREAIGTATEKALKKNPEHYIHIIITTKIKKLK